MNAARVCRVIGGGQGAAVVEVHDESFEAPRPGPSLGDQYFRFHGPRIRSQLNSRRNDDDVRSDSRGVELARGVEIAASSEKLELASVRH